MEGKQRQEVNRGQGRTGGKKWPGSYCQTGPLNTRRAAHSVHGALPTQYTARCPFNASHVSTSQWPTWKNTHTLNIILDDYKEITSYMFFFNNIWIHQFAWVDTWNKMILAIVTLQGRYSLLDEYA